MQDPHNPQALNRYSYCLNNPVKYTDPTGNFAFLAFVFAAIKFIAVAAVVGAAIGAGISIAMGGMTGQINSWSSFGTALLSGAISGAAGGAALGAGTIGIGMGFGAPAVSSIWAKLVLGALSGAVNGGTGSKISGGSFGGGALAGGILGLGLGAVAASPAGEQLGKVIGKTGFGKFLNGINNTMGEMYSSAMNAWYGGSSIGNVPAAFKDVKEVWHATNKSSANSIMDNGAWGGKEGQITHVFNPNEVVNGTRLGDMNAAQLKQALALPRNVDTIIHIPRNTVILQPALNGPATGGGASQAILYGTNGQNVGPYGSWYATSVQSPSISIGIDCPETGVYLPPE